MAIVPLPTGVADVQAYAGQSGKSAGRSVAPSVASLLDIQAEAPPVAKSILPTTSPLDATVAAALGRQDGLAPLFADVEALAGLPSLPDALKSAVDALMALRLGGDSLGGDAVKAAVSSSGLFHEGNVAGAAASAGLVAGQDRVMASVASGDLKGVLFALRMALVGWVPAAARPASGGLAAGQTRRDRPPPLRSGTPLSGQGAETRDLRGLDPSAIASRLVESVERGLWRLTLNQIAAIGGHGGKGDAAPDQAAPTAPLLAVELPLAGPGGTSVMQLAVYRDPDEGDRSGQDGDETPWRAELAFDVDPIGPVTVRVGLMADHRVALGVWCDSDAALVSIDSEREALTDELTAIGLTVTGIDLHRGRPAAAVAAASGTQADTLGQPHRLDVEL